MLTNKKNLNVHLVLMSILTLGLVYLCFRDLKKEEFIWNKEQDILSIRQHDEWQRKQLQMGQELLILVQPLLENHELIDLIHRTYQKQNNQELISTEKRNSQHQKLYSLFEPYWLQMHKENVSELNLYVAPEMNVISMGNPEIMVDSLGQSRPELTQVFNTGKTTSLFAVSRQGTAYRLLIPLFQRENQTTIVLELAMRMENKTSTVALLHKQIVDMLLWDKVVQQMHPTLVGDWRLEEGFEPISSWWKDGLVVAEKKRQLIQVPEGVYLVNWIDHSSRRLALLIWGDISVQYNLHMNRVNHIYWIWISIIISTNILILIVYLYLNRAYKLSKINSQQQLAREHQKANESNARVALALRSSNSGFWEWDIVKNRIKFSPEWRALLKLPPGKDEMEVSDWLDVLDPNFRRGHHVDMINHLKGLTPMFENEYRVKTGEEDYRWILSRGKVIERDVSGRATLIIGIYTDITERKDIELMSVRQQAALQTLNEITSLPLDDTDDQLRRGLILAAKYLGVTTAGISQIKKSRYRLRIFVDVREKTHTPMVTLENTYCSLVVAARGMIAVDDMRNSKYSQHPVLQRNGHESYIGTPIIISGVLYGTLFFSAPKSRQQEYDQLDKDFVQLLARWASTIIDRAIRDEDKKVIIDRFKKLSEHLPGFLYQYQLRPDGSSFYPYASPGILNIYGVTPEEVAQNAEKIIEAIHPDELGWIAETVSYSASSLTPWVATVRVNNPNRGLVWTHVQSIPEKLEDGSVLWHGYVSDITSLKNTEVKLERANAMHQAIFDAASVAIITTDTEGIIKTFNRGAELMLGYTAEELINKYTPEKIHSDEEIATKARQLSEKIGYKINPGFDVFIVKVKDGEIDENEWTYIRKDGVEIPVVLTVSALHDRFGDITGYLGIARDIGELKRIDRMKNEFVSTVSHELRTPLTSISGALGIVSNGLAGVLPEQAANMVKIAYKNSLRLIYLVNDLLDMEKLLAGKMEFNLEVCSIVDVINNSLESNSSFAKQHKVSYQLSSQVDDVEIKVDVQRLQQVITNYLSNAAKFSPEGSVINITCELKFGLIKVTVHDNGPGIPDKFRERIFQKFSQADSSDSRQKGGTGLGLAICKELIERMNGKVGFESRVGEGSSFYFELPIEKVPEYSGQLIDGNTKIRILIVEDDSDFAEYLRNLFQERGYLVDLAANGNTALALVEHNTYDLVTLDLFLSDMNGTEILKDIRSREELEHMSDNPTPVVIISVNPDDGKKRLPEFMRYSKAVYWIQKPMVEGEPLMTIDYALMLKKKAKES